MRILLLSQWFQPEPTTFKGLPFALELQRLGHQVEVLTGFPNYPSGRVYPPYTIAPRMTEVMQGIRVVRVPLYPSHDRSALRRSLNYISFALSAATIGLCSVTKPDVVYAYQPPATAILPAQLYRLLRGVPYVLDIQDLWPDTVTATGMFQHPVGLKALGAMCQGLYRTASHIVVLSPGFKLKLIERGVSANKITVMPNWAEDDLVRPVERQQDLARSLGLANRFNVMFAGNMGLAQGLDTVLDAAEMLLERHPLVQFVMVGGGVDVPRLKNEAIRRSLSNVVFIERQPIEKMSSFFALADVMLVHLADLPLFRITIPSKIQAYLASGRPILCAVAGDAADLVQQAGAGITCPPQNPQALANCVSQLLNLDSAARENLGKAGLRYYTENLALNIGAKRFAELFERVVHLRVENDETMV